MPTPTYTLIQETNLVSNTSGVTFSSIPQTYKDLIVEISGSLTADADNWISYTLNGSSSSYSTTTLWSHVSNGNNAAADRRTNNSTGWLFRFSSSSSTPGHGIINFMSYSNNNIFKTVVSRLGYSSDGLSSSASLWQNTNAITSITINANYTAGSGNWATGTSFRLWGVIG